MSTTGELINSFDTLRQDIAKFYRVVLHAHATDSHDYGRDLNGKIGTGFPDEQSFEDYLVDSKLDLIAVTDHMKCDYACRLSETISKRGKCVLPGMEVNLRPPAPWNTFRRLLSNSAVIDAGQTI